MNERIYLSPPHQAGTEGEAIQRVLEGNWIAPLGPEVDAFEVELADQAAVGHAAALSSGTAALHLALRVLEIPAGSDVLCSSFTFAASAFPILYEGAVPVFIDAAYSTWNMDPELLEAELKRRAENDSLPAAVVVVDLYGQAADYDRILPLCQEYDVPLIEDAAEALGATCGGRPAGGFGTLGVFSFNGNKIITTSGGGALVSDDGDLIERARFLATQARDPAAHYQHSTVGYNYRMSNLLAAVGRTQLAVLPDRVERRRWVFDQYVERLGDLAGIAFMPEAAYGRSNRWLTCMTIDAQLTGTTPETIRLALEAENIEARPLWKPMHLQPIFERYRMRGGDVSARLFETGLCLPSGSALTAHDIDRIASIVRGCVNA